MSLLPLLLLTLWAGLESVPAATEPAKLSSAGDLLQFLDGSSLHGTLKSMDASRGIGWKHPDVTDWIEFRQTNIAWIRFGAPQSVPASDKPSCRFRFYNGDEVFGRLHSIDEQNIHLDTWFGGSLQAPRQAVQSLTFLSKGYSVLYEGPSGMQGWVEGRSPHGWDYRDGALVATNAGTLGRDLHLTGSSSISFDLAWNGHFSLILALYTSVLDRFDYSSSSYMFYLSPGYITLRRIQGGAGAVDLGQTQIPEMTRKSKMHLELRANKPDATLGLFVDDHLVQRWKDSAGFVGQGSGIVFFGQLDGPTIKISNIKVAQWEGEFGLENSTNSPTKEDLVYLVNRDRVNGKLRSLNSGTATVTTALSALEIPLARVTQISFGNSVTNRMPTDPWELRAYFAGGGTVAFQLQDWTDQRATGRSANFGTVHFDPQFIRQLQFNLDRARLGAEDVEILDQEVWDE